MGTTIKGTLSLAKGDVGVLVGKFFIHRAVFDVRITHDGLLYSGKFDRFVVQVKFNEVEVFYKSFRLANHGPLSAEDFLVIAERSGRKFFGKAKHIFQGVRFE